MRLHWVRARVFVHDTEDEDRVRNALLRVLGLGTTPRDRDRVERRRSKGLHGNDILVLEAALTRTQGARAALEGILSAPAVRAEALATLERRLDEDGVLHLRLDKQAAVEGRLALAARGDDIVVRAKAVLEPGEEVHDAWRRRLEAPASATPRRAPTIL